MPNHRARRLARRLSTLFVLVAALAALSSQAPSLAGVPPASDQCEACYSAYTACMDQGYGYGVCCPAYNNCLGDDPWCPQCPEW
jgi:hypothetical protein